MSGLFSAVGRGLSAAGYAAGDLFARQALQEHSSDLEMNRQQRLLEFKEALEGKAREQQVQRIDAKAGELADEQVAPKRGLIDAGITDRSAWTDEQQAAVDQSLEMERQAARKDPKTRMNAAIATGDISPKDAATFTQKDEATMYKLLWEREKEERRDSRFSEQQDRIDERQSRQLAAQMASSDKRLAYLFAALEKRGAKGADGTREALAFLDGSRKEIQSEAQNLRQLYQAQIKDKSKGEIARIDAEYAPKFAEVERKRGMIEEDYNHVRERVGLPARGKPETPSPAPTPKPAAPAAAPKPGGRPPLSAFDRK